jgi:uroporphyrinogen III methyltransferase/synthase
MNSGAENQPAYSALSGKTVFAAASAKLLPELASGLRAFGADVLAVAVLEAKELEDAEYAGALDRAITNIGGYDWIIFTSAWGVSFFAKRLARTFHEDPAGAAQAGISALRPLAANPDGISGMPSMANSVDAPPKICAIGPATAEAAKDHGFCVALTADEFTAEGIMRALERYYGGGENLRGLSFLIPRALEAR